MPKIFPIESAGELVGVHDGARAVLVVDDDDRDGTLGGAVVNCAVVELDPISHVLVAQEPTKGNVHYYT